MTLTSELRNYWLKSGIQKGDNLLFHLDTRRTFFYFKKKYINFEVDNFFDSLLEIILPEGTIAFPTFNFDFNKGVTFDYLNTPSRMGSLTEHARLSKLSYRTLNPVYSFSIIGKIKKKFQGIDNISWYSKDSPFHIFNELNFKIFILDLEDNDSMTFLHYCEEFFQVNYRYYKNFSGYYIDGDKKKFFKTYKGYVRKLENGIVTSCNNAANILWERKLYKGCQPKSGNGIRYIFTNDYFNFFKECFELNRLENFFYKKNKKAIY
jgi:aminoglycoside 3-N-acetyltransferase